MQEGGILAVGYQYLVQPYYYPPVGAALVNDTVAVNWTIVVNIDAVLFFPDDTVVYNVGLPILGAALAALSMVVAAIFVVSLTRPLRRVARQLNAVARLRLRSIRRRHAHIRARQAATSDSETDATGSTTLVRRIGQTKAARGRDLMSFGFSCPWVLGFLASSAVRQAVERRQPGLARRVVVFASEQLAADANVRDERKRYRLWSSNSDPRNHGMSCSAN